MSLPDGRNENQLKPQSRPITESQVLYIVLTFNQLYEIIHVWVEDRCMLEVDM